jgi:uncharacterized protein YndB with AHSA1/START domain
MDKKDFRAPSEGKRAPRAIANSHDGVIFAVADVGGTPERTFNALTTNEVERWWSMPNIYRQKDFKADLHVCGQWSVAVETTMGDTVHANGEFCEIRFPEKLVMTRRFSAHPFQGNRETTITYYFEPSTHGTRITVKDEGFIGRSEAAFGNAEIWEKVLSWLDAYLTSSQGTA